MVSYKEVKAANDAIVKSHTSLTAVFVGATSGIGLAALKAFAKRVQEPKAIIVGRSEKRFAPELESLRKINPQGEFTFVEEDVSLIKNIDAVCGRIKGLVSAIDLLITSQGYISFVGREDNADGLDNSMSLRYYGRVRFTQDLLPIIKSGGRAVTVLAGSQEGKILEDDLDLKDNYSLANSMGSHIATIMTLSYDKLAQQYPEIGFVHEFPGVVSTGLLGKSATGILGFLFRWLLEPMMGFFATSAEEAGERVLYCATTEQFSRGSWAVDSDGTAKEVQALVDYRKSGMADKVWEHNERVFERATSA